MRILARLSFLLIAMGCVVDANAQYCVNPYPQACVTQGEQIAPLDLIWQPLSPLNGLGKLPQDPMEWYYTNCSATCTIKYYQAIEPNGTIPATASYCDWGNGNPNPPCTGGTSGTNCFTTWGLDCGTPTGCGPGQFDWATQQTCTDPLVTMGCRCPGPGMTSGCWALACDSGTGCCDCPAYASAGWSQLNASGQAACATPTATPTSTPPPCPADCSVFNQNSNYGWGCDEMCGSVNAMGCAPNHVPAFDPDGNGHCTCERADFMWLLSCSPLLPQFVETETYNCQFTPACAPAVSPTPTATPVCPNWNGTSWNTPTILLQLPTCGSCGGSPYITPWGSCPADCISIQCFQDVSDPSWAGCPCPAYGSANFNAMSGFNQARCCAADSSTPTPTPTPTATPVSTPAGAIPCVNGPIVCDTYDQYTVTTNCLISGCVLCATQPPGAPYDLDGTGRCSCTDSRHDYRGPGCIGSADLWWYRDCTGAGGNYSCSATPTPTPTVTPTITPTPTPAPSSSPCELLGDPNRTDCTTCKADYVKVARPFPMPAVPPPATPFRVQSTVWVNFESQILYAQQKRDYRFLEMLKPMIDAVCPSAGAQAVSCASDETCEKDIFAFCQSALAPGAGCTKTVTYANGGTTPAGCTPASGTCSVAVNCPAWTPDGTNFRRHCTVADTCFTGDPQTCGPFNRFEFTINAGSTDGTQLINMMGNGDMMCIPDCERFDGGTATGLSYVWSGTNAGACACALGYVYNPTTKKCVSATTLLGCDAGSANIPPSPVSPRVTGADYAARFNNTVNKKMGCCLNGLENNAAMAKFDCVDNSVLPGDFNTLWASADSALGEQLNAIELTGANGQIITGWYSMSGKRDNRYSEFTNATIQPGIINAKSNPGQIMTVSGTQQNIGSAIAKPTSPAWAAMIAARTAAGMTTAIPTTLDEKRNTPLLVRAAAVYTCPRNAIAGVKTPLRQVLSGGLVVCPVAASIAVHLRIEQVWRIAGTPEFRVIDTVLDRSQMNGVSIDQLLGEKYGPGCGPGMFQQGDACVH